MLPTFAFTVIKKVTKSHYKNFKNGSEEGKQESSHQFITTIAR